MGRLTENERIKEYENIKEALDSLDIAANILEAKGALEQSCLLISLPTDVEDWQEEYETDLHMATCNLIQLDDSEEQLTKYLLLYAPVQVDVSKVDELTLLRFINDTNKTLPVGTCFLEKETGTDRVLLQIKWLIGGYVDELLDEAVVCEAIAELGCIYDSLKEALIELGGFLYSET